MANKIKLGNRPKAFKEITLTVTLPDGTEGVLPVTFKYMTKKEFGAWQDAAMLQAKIEQPQGGEMSWEAFYTAMGERSADALLGVMEAWGLDIKLTRDALLDIEADCGAGVFPALFDAFGKACREGRLGN